jgi:hypothetical protein
MATTYTLEEAADKLGLSEDEFRKRLNTEWAKVQRLRDGNTLRFREKDIEELARQMGLGSEEELRLADPSSNERVIPKELGSVDESDGGGKSATGKRADDAPTADDPLVLGDKDVFLIADDKPAAPAAPARTTKSGSDSDVRLEKSGKMKPPPKKKDDTGTDEIELDVLPTGPSPSGKMTPVGSGRLSIGSGSGKKTSPSSGKLKGGSGTKISSGKSGKLPPIPPPDADSSDFELTLDPDSSDEFELSLATDSDEISLGDMPSEGKAGASGIGINKPVDSGINLEKKKGDSSKKKGDSGSKKSPTGKVDIPGAASRHSGDVLKRRKDGEEVPSDTSRHSGDVFRRRKGADDSATGEDEIDFELSLDKAGASSKKTGSGSGKKKTGSGVSKKKVDSDSEFELTLDEEGSDSDLEGQTSAFPEIDEQKNDIFETDFEIPALDDDSASEAVAIDEADTDLESSDFDLAIDESGSVEDESASQVVVLDDETEEPPAKKTKKPLKKSAPLKARKLVEPVEEIDPAAPPEDAVSFDEVELDEGLSASKALEGARAETEEDETEEAQERVVVAQSAPWGVFPALLMLPTVFVIFLGGIMAYELMHSMWGYHQPTKPATLVIDNVAKALDMQPKE